MLQNFKNVCSLSGTKTKEAKLILPIALRALSSQTSNTDANSDSNNPRILITGGLGQLGTGMAKLLRSHYGRDNVILSDIVRPTPEVKRQGPFQFIDILDPAKLRDVVVSEDIDWIIHFSALLSAVGERNVPHALKINIDGLHNVLETAKQYNTRLFVPSTIGAFGPESPLHLTPNVTIQRPKTIYGISKVHAELMGEYYHKKFNLDFRSLRLPGIVSYDTVTGGGTTDYAVQIFHDAISSSKHHSCFLSKSTRLPMMYIEDCLNGIHQFLKVDSQKLKRRTYNIAGHSFTPEELFEEVKTHVPDITITYDVDERQAIAESWPQVLDDSEAREDWGWKSEFDIHRIVQTMFDGLASKRNSTI